MPFAQAGGFFSYAAGTRSISRQGNVLPFEKGGQREHDEKPADCKIFTEIEELPEFKDKNAERILESGRGVKTRKVIL
jgi:hypothetical protein